MSSRRTGGATATRNGWVARTGSPTTTAISMRCSPTTRRKCRSDLVGHSMGANIAAVYASARPQTRRAGGDARFSRPDGHRTEGCTETARPVAGSSRRNAAAEHYADHDALAKRMQQVNPRLSDEKAAYLARALSWLLDDGRVQMACDPWHPRTGADPLPDRRPAGRVEYDRGPVLMLLSDEGFVHERFGDDPVEQERRLAAFRNLQVETIGDCSHNLQHDQPHRVAAALERYLARD